MRLIRPLLAASAAVMLLAAGSAVGQVSSASPARIEKPKPKASATPIPVPTPAVRTPVAKRKFTSTAIDQEIARVRAKIADPELSRMFELCFANTADTTVTLGTRNGKPDTFIITGDINAMWLRDSSAQVQAYIRFCKQDPQLAQMIAGVIHRQAACILIDPYANAFMRDTTARSPHNDKTDTRGGVFERKWELDSLCYTIRLAYQYWKVTGDTATFDKEWQDAARLDVATMRDQQRMNGQGKYTFIRGRVSGDPNVAKYGSPIQPTGMICTRFRNSDDATTYQFNIPDELMAVASLHQLGEMCDAIMPGDPLAADCRALADEVAKGVAQYGIVNHPKYGKIYAYECDGMGHTLLMDDAGIPGLMSIPYFSPELAKDPVSLASRAYALSFDDPWYCEGTAAQGICSVHKGKNYIWPIALCMRGLTSTNNAEITDCLGMLKNSTAGTGLMHESFNKDNPLLFSRKWFAWANNLFGELIIQVLAQRPELLAKPVPGWHAN